jgi:primase-polymerase (primpol)-like protein
VPNHKPLDKQVIEAIKWRGNANARALWHGAYADLYETQSEADIALMHHIWNFSNEYEPAQIARVFKQSELYRSDKWDELIYGTDTTYGWYTIRKVVSG